jgi:hypothetical protein
MPTMEKLGMGERRDPLEKRAEKLGQTILAAAVERQVRGMAAAGEFRDVASFAGLIADQLDGLGPELTNASVSASANEGYGDGAVTHRIVIMSESGTGVILRLRYDAAVDGFHVIGLVRAD